MENKTHDVLKSLRYLMLQEIKTLQICHVSAMLPRFAPRFLTTSFPAQFFKNSATSFPSFSFSEKMHWWQRWVLNVIYCEHYNAVCVTQFYALAICWDTCFFYKQRFFFSTQPQCCLTFSWIQLRMLLRWCLY